MLLRQCLVFSLLFFFSSAYVCAINEDELPKKGSWLSAKLNRKALREYSSKLQSRTITRQEAVDYIAKGGSIDALQYYDRVRTFFHSEPRYSLLTTFIRKRYDHHEEPAENRLQLLKLFLEVGANPNFLIQPSGLHNDGYLAPVLHAAAADDVDALKVLLAYGASLELTEETYLGAVGPALALANRINTLNWLLKNGASLDAKDEQGRTLLHMAVVQNASLDKVNWLLGHGLDAAAKDKYGDSPIDKVNQLIESIQYKISSYRTQLLEARASTQDLLAYIAADQAVIEQLEAIRSRLTNP